MNIIQMQDLGYVGVDILENLEEIKDSVSQIKNVKFNKGSDFKDSDHLKEYICDTINMISLELAKLKIR